MLRLLLLFSIFFASDLFASDPEIFYYTSNNRPCTEDEAILKLELSDAEKKRKILKIFTASGDDWKLALQKEIEFSSNNKMKITVRRNREVVDRYKRKYEVADSGLYKFTEKKRGLLIRQGFTSRLLPLHLEGVETSYYEKGHVKSVSIYRNNQLLSNQNWLFNGRRSHDNIFQSVDEAPSYIDGDEKIHEYLRAKIRSVGIPIADLDGTIRMNLVIMENGKLGAINLLTGLREDMDDAVMRTMIDLPGDWKPAILNGDSVRSTLVFPVHFYLGAKGPQSHQPELPGAVMFWW
ncbi:hypothetical protein ACFLTA_00095 [Bacteroidota bacterium]